MYVYKYQYFYHVDRKLNPPLAHTSNCFHFNIYVYMYAYIFICIFDCPSAGGFTNLFYLTMRTQLICGYF